MMGSITEITNVDKRSGKQTKKYRAYVRRLVAGRSVGASKVCASRKEAAEWIRNNESDIVLLARTRDHGSTFAQLVDVFIRTPPSRGTKYCMPSHINFWKAELGHMHVVDIVGAHPILPRAAR